MRTSDSTDAGTKMNSSLKALCRSNLLPRGVHAAHLADLSSHGTDTNTTPTLLSSRHLSQSALKIINLQGHKIDFRSVIDGGYRLVRPMFTIDFPCH